MQSIENLKRRIVQVESMLILLSVAAIAYGDYFVGRQFSLGYLYLIPLSYSALVHRARTSLGLAAFCIFLREWFGPVELSPWALIARDWILAVVFLSVVWVLHRLGRYRRDFFEKALAQRDELAAEVALAAEVQQHLLGAHLASGSVFDIGAQTWPAKVVGGDYYDFIDLGNGNWSIVIADISGKGLPAAMLMPAAQIALRTLASGGKNIDAILQEFNAVLFQATDRARYATLFYGALDQKTGRLCYVNAGHLPGLVFRRKGGEVARLASGGPPVGLFEKASYEVAETRLDGGDLLILYSDGLIDAENREGQPFGEEQLVDLVPGIRDRPSRGIIQSIHEALMRFVGDANLPDDLTVIAIKAPNLPDDAV